MIIKGVIITLLSAVTAVCLFSCATKTDATVTPAVTRAVEEILFTEGEVTMLALNSVTIRTENGMEYCFAMDDETELPDDELVVGGQVSIGYHSGEEKAQIALSVRHIE